MKLNTSKIFKFIHLYHACMCILLTHKGCQDLKTDQMVILEEFDEWEC